MLWKAGKAQSMAEARGQLEHALKTGKAFDKFLQWIQAQGGDVEQALHPELLPAADFQMEVLSPGEGYVEKIDTEDVGRISLLLGVGRETI